MEYIATFFNHFGAVRFRRTCLQMGWKAVLAPVPRALSSSCGTCVIFSPAAGDMDPSAGEEVPQVLKSEELEQIVRAGENGEPGACIYRAPDS